MNTWLRPTIWKLRAIRMKLQNIPLQTCRTCTRRLQEAWESPWTSVYVIVFSFWALFCVIIGLIVTRDPCFQWDIKTRLCEDYRNGLIAGVLCYDLCVDKTIWLSSCVEHQDSLSVFSWNEHLIKARTSRTLAQGTARQDQDQVDKTIWEGMTVADFIKILENHLNQILGTADHSRLIERILDYADFNQDKKIQYGEIRSLWQLLQIKEFQTLLLFQRNSVFPQLNGTCGDLYAVEATYQEYLYDKTSPSFIDKIFPNRYRWGIPNFEKRAHIALGLLEYAYTILEEENTRFYMCNFNPRNFGYSNYYEMKVTNVEGIVSQAVLNRTLHGRKCMSRRDCMYGDICQSACNVNTQTCAGVTEKYIPETVKICQILQEYVLYHIPEKIKHSFGHLVAECIRIEKQLGESDPDMVRVDEMLLLDRMNKALWDEIKYTKMNWLKRPTKRQRL